MRAILTSTALASLLLVAGVTISSPRASAQDGQPCVGENCPKPDMQGEQDRKKYDQDTDNQTGQTPMRKKRIQGSTDQDDMPDGQMPRKKKVQQSTDVDVDVDVRKKGASRSDWKYVPGKHQRRKSKSGTYIYFYNGWWYPQPYWEVYTVGRGRYSCGAGRAIVAERFNRVRVVECNGGTYTYLGRREGDTYRVLVNARTGRIVGRTLI